jgi:hypothetical protein
VNSDLEKANRFKKMTKKGKAIPLSKLPTRREVREQMLGVEANGIFTHPMLVSEDVRKLITRAYLKYAKLHLGEDIAVWKKKHDRWEELCMVRQRRGVFNKQFQDAQRRKQASRGNTPKRKKKMIRGMSLFGEDMAADCDDIKGQVKAKLRREDSARLQEHEARLEDEKRTEEEEAEKKYRRDNRMSLGVHEARPGSPDSSAAFDSPPRRGRTVSYDPGTKASPESSPERSRGGAVTDDEASSPGSVGTDGRPRKKSLSFLKKDEDEEDDLVEPEPPRFKTLLTRVGIEAIAHAGKV